MLVSTQSTGTTWLSMSSAYLTISSTLWKVYGYELPDAPSKMSSIILFALEKDGYKIEKDPHLGKDT